MKIKVFEKQCWSKGKMVASVEEALKDLGLSQEIEIISEMIQIVKSGIMSNPALMINGKVKAAGKVPSIKELKNIIEAEMKNE